MTKQMQKGFTLIELMVVIVIIGILAAIAIPSYLDNANRAKVTEGINLMAPAKAGVSEAYIGLGVMPTDQAAAGMADPTDYDTDIVQQISYSRTSDTVASIAIAYKAFAGDVTAGNTIIFQATGDSNGVSWECSGTGGTLPQKYMPANCRGS